MNVIQQALLVLKFIELIIEMVQKVAVLLPDSPGKTKAQAVMAYILTLDDDLEKAVPVLEKTIEWAYQLFVKAKEVQAEVTK